VPRTKLSQYMTSSASPQSLYQRGDALEDAFPDQSLGESQEGLWTPPPVSERAHLFGLSEREYEKWLRTLLEEGARLDAHLADLLEQAYDLEPPFYSIE